MIGIGEMDVSPEQMQAMVQRWWNNDLVIGEKHRVTIVDVRQRTNGRFVITFQGHEPKPPVRTAKEDD